MVRSPVALLVILTGLNFLCYLDRILPAPLQLPLQQELLLSNFASGVLQTAFLVGYVLASPLFGARAHRGGRKGLLAMGVVLWSVATIACGLAGGLTVMLLSRLLVGIGQAAYAVTAPTLVDDLSPPERKGRNLAFFYLAVPVGSACGYLLGGFVEVRWGWRAAFLAGGAPGIALALLCLVIAEPARQGSPAPAAAEQPPLGALPAMRALWSIPLYRRCVIGYCAHTAAIGAFGYWAPKFLVHRYALPLETANFWFGLITVVAGFIAILLGGKLADRAVARLPAVPESAPVDGPENVAAITALLRICGIGMWISTPLVVATFLVPTPELFFALEFAAQLGLFIAISPVSSALLRAAPPHLRASAMAIAIFSIHGFGDLWSPPAVGALADVLPMAQAMMLVPALLAFGAAVWWPLQRRKRSPWEW
jgi:MFS transporter, Spinster family, sphingosine-1-phosphate transporter